MSTFDLYVLLMLPQIGFVLNTVSWIATAVLIISGGFLYGCGKDYPENEEVIALGKRFMKWSFLPMVMIFLSAFLPTEKVMYALVAWELGGGIDGMSSLPEQFVQYLSELMKEHVAEMTGGEK